MIAIIVTTYNRPQALRRSLPQIARLGAPVLVVDDGSEISHAAEYESLAKEYGQYLRLPCNRGLAAALNIGLSYWMADKSIDWISYFQDDVDVHPRALEVLTRIGAHSQILTGHDAAAHPVQSETQIGGIPVRRKWSCAGVHLHATADFWRGLMPIPTYALGAPKRIDKGNGRGMGSNVDWWIVRDAPQSSQHKKMQVLCVPGLVRTFYWKPQDSSWNNFLPTGEEPPLATWIN